MDLIGCLMEVIKELLLLSLEVLELLKPDFILPLDVFEDSVMVHDLSLGLFKFVHDLVMDTFLLWELLNLFWSFLERFNDLLVGFFLVHLLLLFAGVFFLGVSQLIFQLLDDV